MVLAAIIFIYMFSLLIATGIVCGRDIYGKMTKADFFVMFCPMVNTLYILKVFIVLIISPFIDKEIREGVKKMFTSR